MAMQNADRPKLARELESSFRTTDPAIARHFAAATFLCDHRRELAGAPVPSLLLQSAEDEGRPVESLLPAASRVFFHTYFFPRLRLRGSLEEVYLRLAAGSSDVQGWV